jgi:hypothetical protein
LSDADTEGIRNYFERAQRHALLARFETINVDSVQARGLRELILRESPFLSESRDPIPDNDLDVTLQP